METVDCSYFQGGVCPVWLVGRNGMPLSKSNLESEDKSPVWHVFFLCKGLRASLKDNAKPQQGRFEIPVCSVPSWREGIIHDFLLRQWVVLCCSICIDLCFLFYIWAVQSEMELQLRFTCLVDGPSAPKPIEQATMSWINDEQLSTPNWLSQAQYPNSLGGSGFLYWMQLGSPLSTHCLEGRWYQIIITKRNHPPKKRLQQPFPGVEKK